MLTTKIRKSFDVSRRAYASCGSFLQGGCTPGIPWVCRSSCGRASSPATRKSTPHTSTAPCSRRFRHRRRRPVLIDVLARQLLPELAVLLAPHEEVVRLARRRMIRALRAPAGSVRSSCGVHLRPPHVLALDVAALPLRLVVRRFVTAVGGLSLSTYSRDSFLPSSPFFSHHARKLFVLLSDMRFRALRAPAGFVALRAVAHCARHTCLHVKHFHFAL